MFNNEVFDRLNKEQQEAVLHTEGPLLILAGAGSGKTRVLTCRIAHLVVDNNVAPRNILAVTFTNKAAKEMRTRATALVKGYDLSDMWACTFHSMCARILRSHYEKLGYKPRFEIFDADDSVRVMKDVLEFKGMPNKKNDAKEWLDKISSLKSQAITPEAAREAFNINPLIAEAKGDTVTIYEEYQRRLRESNAMDFDDLQMNVELLFEKDEKALHQYADRFHYIMVDEYQDTNQQQFRLIHKLAQGHGNIMVVGDDDQSIYGFRGADIHNILDFEKHFEGTHVVKLEQNYRSTRNILDAANAVIANNKVRKSKALRTDAGPGDLLTLFEGELWGQEADYTADVIKMLHQSGRSYKDVAILYRINAQAAQYEKSFMKASIPYKIIGGHAFFERAEVKDLIAYLKLIYNNADGLSARRIINVPKRNIGQKTIQKIQEYANVREIPFIEALANPNIVGGLSPKTVKKIRAFFSLMYSFSEDIESKTVDDILQEVIHQTDFINHLRESKEDLEKQQERIDHVMVLAEYARGYTHEHNGAKGADVLGDFLEEIALISGSERESGDLKGDSVSLMTIHTAKGLEFPVVFLAGMTDGLFPNTWHGDDEEIIEEERRLCYVGITRAKERLYLTRTVQSNLGWRPSSQNNSQNDEDDKGPKPSRFLEEIPKHLLTYADTDQQPHKEKKAWEKTSVFPL